MDKLAVFVEGYTEVVFVEKLIEEIAGRNKVRIESKKIRGGNTVRRSMRLIASQPDTGQTYYALILDCGGDNQVKSRILEEHENLTQAGYSGIIGIRDVLGKTEKGKDRTHADIPRLEAGLPRYIKTKLAPVTFILSIMEIEAWFLAEWTHFPRIEPSITPAAIKSTLGFDPETDDMAQRLRPADDLNDCYAIGAKTYEKRNALVTVDALDFTLIYTDLRAKIPYLDKLNSVIDDFLS